MTLEGEFQLMGFYTTRWVEADSANTAELAALELLREEYQFSDEDKRKAPDAKVYFEEVVEVLPGDEGPNSGATWFPMDED